MLPLLLLQAVLAEQRWEQEQKEKLRHREGLKQEHDAALLKGMLRQVNTQQQRQKKEQEQKDLIAALQAKLRREEGAPPIPDTAAGAAAAAAGGGGFAGPGATQHTVTTQFQFRPGAGPDAIIALTPAPTSFDLAKDVLKRMGVGGGGVTDFPTPAPTTSQQARLAAMIASAKKAVASLAQVVGGSSSNDGS